MPGSHRSLYVAEAIESEGHKVDIVTSDQDSSGWKARKEILSTNITIFWLPVKYKNEFGFFRRLLAFLKFCLISSYYSLKLKPDIIYATSTPLTISIPALAAKFLKGTDYVFEVRDLWPQAPIAIGVLKNKFLIKLAKLLEFQAYKHAESVVCLSPDMEKGVKSLFPLKDTSMIPNFCNLTHNSQTAKVSLPDKLQEIIKKEDKKIVLYAGTLGPVNHVSYLVDVALKTKTNSIIYIIVGSGSEWDLVKSKAINEGVYDVNFFMLEPIAKNQLEILFKSASISLSLVAQIPELWGNSANKFFDSLAFGCPIFINHEGWLADLIREESLGKVLPGNDPRLASQIIESSIADEVALADMRVNTKNIAKLSFSMEILSVKISKILERAAHRKDV